MLGWALLAALTSLAAIDALALAVRAKPVGRAELGIVAFAMFCALLAGPVLLLGYLDRLDARLLATSSAIFFVVLFAVLSRGSPVMLLRDCRRAAADLAEVPGDALRETWRARSFAFTAVVACAYLVVASIVLTIFVPNATWDGFLYHEPMVGFAIQNRGFAMVPLPMSQAVQATNGYPRLCESLSLWFVIFTDKTLIELPNDLAAPAMILGAYVLARRFGDRVTSMGLACLLLLVPQAWAQLCQTYIDILVASFAIVLVAFATRPRLGLRDAWIATLGAILFLGSKSSALTAAPALLGLAYVRLLASEARKRPRTTIASVLAGSAIAVAFAAVTPLRNWRAFHDPLWPVSIDSTRLGLHWKGLVTLDEITSAVPLPRAVQIAYSAPIGGLGDVSERGYGYALPWVLGPLALVGTIGAIGAVCARRDRRLAALLAATMIALVTAPALNGHNARYDLHIVACLLAICAWTLDRPRLRAVRSQVLAASVVLGVLPLCWMQGPGWYWVSTRHLEDVLRHPLASRVVLERPEFDVIAQARENELHAGDLVVFDQDVTFVGALWNFDYSSRVEFLHYDGPTSFLRAIDAKHPKWVVVGESGAARQLLEHDRGWQYVGPLTPETSAVFRRRPTSG